MDRRSACRASIDLRKAGSLLALVLAHGVAAALAPVLVRALGRRAFLALALAPLAAVVWACAQTGEVLDGGVIVSSTSWIPALGFDLVFTLDALRWLMVLIVAGIGVVVLFYCTWYFTDASRGLVTFASSFIAFVGAMLGLVLADNLLVLFVFWELTTISSFLLIGFNPTSAASRRAAVQALLVTTLGGLAMLIGMLLLGARAETFSLGAILAAPPSGTAITVAVWLMLIGALSKSAILPFQFWLPGAMAAPTPVSAYLHAASMVKAGLFLVAVLAPAFDDTPGWRPVLLTLGVVTMLSGGWRALRQLDIKLLLAFGTVSQLGFLLVLLALGTRTAALAGTALLLGHALFKSTLFLTVGIIDRLTGTRDLQELSGVGRRLPVLTVAAVLAGASMAGLPPLLGFVGKESMWAALLELTHAGNPAGVEPWAGWLLLGGVLVGSMFTVAYTARFLWGAFADKRGVPPTVVAPAPPPFLAGPVLLGFGGLALGFAGAALTSALEPYADQLPDGDHPAYLALWHGWELPLLLTAIAVIVGLGLFRVRDAVCAFQARFELPMSGARVYRAVLRDLDRLSVEVTGRVQRGSAASYLAIILVVLALGPGTAMVLALIEGPEISVFLWDTPGQVLIAVVMILAALFTVRSRRRLRAFILAGVTGYGCGLLFILQGAPDIALTQILVETVALVVAVLVLRRLPDYFTDRPLRPIRYARMALAAVVGAVVSGVLVVAASSRTAEAISTRFAEAAYDFGYGRNVVNVTLVDIRAWDTFGEISVLVVAATGVASLIFLDSRSGGVRRLAQAGPRTTEIRTADQPAPTTRSRTWLPAPGTMSPERRSIVFEVITRMIFHSILLFSVYLLIAGHNLPGGGFAAGMVAGLALMVRYLAGGRYELAEALPVDAGVLIGTGLFVAALSALGPVAFGGQVLQTADVYLSLPLLGELHLVSSVGFDIGVYLVVMGLVLDLLRIFGARLDRQIIQAQRDEAAETHGEVSS